MKEGKQPKIWPNMQNASLCVLIYVASDLEMNGSVASYCKGTANLDS